MPALSQVLSLEKARFRSAVYAVVRLNFSLLQVTFDTPAVDIRWAGENDDSDKVGKLAEAFVALAKPHHCAYKRKNLPVVLVCAIAWREFLRRRSCLA